MKTWRSLLWLVLALGAMPVRGSIVTLNMPTAAVRAGAAIAVEWVVLNAGTTSATYTLPGSMGGRLSDGERVWNVTVEPTRTDVTVGASQFERVALTFALPRDARGRLVLELDQPVTVRGVLDVAEPEQVHRAALAGATPAGEVVPVTPGPALPAASRLKRYYADHFSAHEPMYFVGGTREPAVKFQLSMKYRLLNDAGPLARTLPALRGLHLAYTQRSLWDITSESSPFFDSSYMPEVIYESLAPDTGDGRGFTWIGWQAGAQHESNGRDADSSRSLNLLYFRPTVVFGDLDGWRVILRPKFWAYVGDLSDNLRIQEYRGYAELRAIVGRANRLSVSFTGRVGDDFRKGSLQIDATYPTEFLTGNLAVYLMLQYWTGYGESLLRYEERSEAVRAGISLAR